MTDGGRKLASCHDLGPPRLAYRGRQPILAASSTPRREDASNPRGAPRPATAGAPFFSVVYVPLWRYQKQGYLRHEPYGCAVYRGQVFTVKRR